MNGSKPRFLKTNSCTHTRYTKTQTNMLFSFKQWGGYDLCKENVGTVGDGLDV